MTPPKKVKEARAVVAVPTRETNLDPRRKRDTRPACGATRLASASSPVTRTNSFQPSFVQPGASTDACTMNRSTSVMAFTCSTATLAVRAHCSPVRTAVAHTNASSDLTALLVHLLGRRFSQAVKPNPPANQAEAGHPAIKTPRPYSPARK